MFNRIEKCASPCLDIAGEPLLSSIGIATSTDGGLTWQNRNQIIQGRDEAMLTAETVYETQPCAFNDKQNPQVIDSGAGHQSSNAKLMEMTISTCTTPIALR